MKQLKGKLEFLLFHLPIKLFTDNGEIDLWDYYGKLFSHLNGKKASMDDTMDSITIQSDDKSEYSFEYEKTEDTLLCCLNKKPDFGFSNTGLYLAHKLQSLNGRQVIIDIDDDKISIMANPEEKIFGLYYTHDNCCKIPDGKENEICKIGTENTCIFCAVGTNGFECLKFCSPSARHLLDRFSKNKMNASRIGNCAILGRKEE